MFVDSMRLAAWQERQATVAKERVTDPCAHLAHPEMAAAGPVHPVHPAAEEREEHPVPRSVFAGTARRLLAHLAIRPGQVHRVVTLGLAAPCYPPA